MVAGQFEREHNSLRGSRSVYSLRGEGQFEREQVSLGGSSSVLQRVGQFERE